MDCEGAGALEELKEWSQLVGRRVLAVHREDDGRILRCIFVDESYAVISSADGALFIYFYPYGADQFSAMWLDDEFPVGKVIRSIEPGVDDFSEEAPVKIELDSGEKFILASEVMDVPLRLGS